MLGSRVRGDFPKNLTQENPKSLCPALLALDSPSNRLQAPWLFFAESEFRDLTCFRIHKTLPPLALATYQIFHAMEVFGAMAGNYLQNLTLKQLRQAKRWATIVLGTGPRSDDFY